MDNSTAPRGASTSLGSENALRDSLVEVAVGLAPRLLGQLCRIPAMRSYGSFDRCHWNTALSGVANSRSQEAVLFLVLLHAIPHAGNPYHGQPMLLEWAKGSMQTWADMQLSSGAFNDLYPCEHSYVATAFSGYAVATAASLLGKEGVSDPVLRALNRCGVWLAKATPSPVLNQVLGAAAALAAIGGVLDSPALLAASERALNTAAARQSPEGWFPEYGGPDIGYLSVAVDYLGKVFDLTEDQQAFDMASKALRFLAHFIHPDGSTGGEYGSRGTEYLLPDGLAVFSRRVPLAADMLRSFHRGLCARSLADIRAVDDRYLLFNGYTYLQAAGRDFRLGQEQPDPGPSFVHFEEAGLVRHRGPRLYLVANLRKGGAFYVAWPETGVSFQDGGVLFQGVGQWWTSSMIGASQVERRLPADFSCSGWLTAPLDNRTSVLRVCLLGLAGTISGCIPAGPRILKGVLRRLVVHKRITGGPVFSRRFEVHSDGSLVVTDTGEPPGEVVTIVVGSPLNAIYGESSRFFTPSQLTPSALRLSAQEANLGEGKFLISRRYSPLRDGGVSVCVSTGAPLEINYTLPKRQ